MASVSWQYPQDQLIALRRQNAAAEAATPIATGVDISRLRFRYAIEGDNPPWRPLSRLRRRRQGLYRDSRAASRRARCRRCSSSVRKAMAELVNYRVRQNYYIVDRLFAAAELRLGGETAADRPHRRAPTGGRGERPKDTKSSAGPRRSTAATCGCGRRAAARDAPVAQGAGWPGAAYRPRHRRARSSGRCRTSSAAQQARQRALHHRQPHHGRRSCRPAARLCRPAARRRRSGRRCRAISAGRSSTRRTAASPSADRHAAARSRRSSASRRRSRRRASAGCLPRPVSEQRPSIALDACGRPRHRARRLRAGATSSRRSIPTPRRTCRTASSPSSTRPVDRRTVSPDRLANPGLTLCRAGGHRHSGGADHRHPLRSAGPDHRAGHGERL